MTFLLLLVFLMNHNKGTQILQPNKKEQQKYKRERERERKRSYLLQEGLSLILLLVSWQVDLCLEQHLSLKCTQWRMEEPQIFLHDLSFLHKLKATNWLAREKQYQVWINMRLSLLINKGMELKTLERNMGQLYWTPLAL